MKRIFAVSLFLAAVSAVSAKVTMPQLFQPGMVLQRNQPIPVWGTADAGETVSVTFKKKTYQATADANGQWRIDLPKQKAGGPFELTVNGQVIDNVMVGDVWLCSGQSNIDVTIERVYPQYGKVIDDYQNPDIRMFRVLTDVSTTGPKGDIKPPRINWQPVTRDNAWLFSAVGYFLGREMYEKTGVPQGIIVNSVGGTPIQAWLDADTLRQHFPQEYNRTVFYQDDQMVSALQRANMLAQNRWSRMLDETDPGMSKTGGDASGSPLFSQKSFDDSRWELKEVFTKRADGLPQSVNLTRGYGYTGSFWARQDITIDAAHAGKAARLLVGTLYDADQTFVNGRQVGSTGYQYPPRRYTIPAGLLTAGKNVLTVRFTTKGGSPHFIPDKPYKLIFDDGTEVQLATQWRIHEGARMPQSPSADAGGQNLPTVLYNAMLHPLAPYALTGVVWYQGESNTGNDARNYEQWLTQLVSGWRQLWQKPDLPFMVVQLANFMDPTDRPQDSGWSQVREAQRLVAKRQPNAELACIIDLGETVDIHPLRKREVAQRIALGFEKMLWNNKVLLSPEVVKATADNGKVILTLDQPLRDEGTLYEFEVAGDDGKFVNADANGQGATITISSPVAQPKRVRYAWKNNPIRANAFGKNGLPMAPCQLTVD